MEDDQNCTLHKMPACFSVHKFHRHFSLKFEYSVPDNQLEALIAMSDYCEQDILFQVLCISSIQMQSSNISV